MVHSTSEASGDVPPAMIGSATVIVGSTLYLFGGKLRSSEGEFVNTLYQLDLATSSWTKLFGASSEAEAPSPRYLHSLSVWDDYLVVYGGLGYSESGSKALEIPSKIHLFRLKTFSWLPPIFPPTPLKFTPTLRYSHLSSVSSTYLIIVGGLKLNKDVIQETNVFDLKRRQWILALRGEESLGGPLTSTSTSLLLLKSWSVEIDDEVEGLTYSVKEDVERELICFENDADESSQSTLTSVKGSSLSNLHPSFSLPELMISWGNIVPSIHYPRGGIVGSHVIVAGKMEDFGVSDLAIWSFDLKRLEWSRLTGEKQWSPQLWDSGVLVAEQNTMIFFPTSLDHPRAIAFNSICTVRLDAFGVYHPPSQPIPITDQKSALIKLRDKINCDMQVLTAEGRSIHCSSSVLFARGQWLRRMCDPDDKHTVPIPGQAYVGSDSSLIFPETYQTTLAFIQYLYTLSLRLTLQQRPAVSRDLLRLSRTYDLPHLTELVLHNLQLTLNLFNALEIAQICEVCQCPGLRTRALTLIKANQTLPVAIKKQPGIKRPATAPVFDSQSMPSRPLNIGTSLSLNRSSAPSSMASLPPRRPPPLSPLTSPLPSPVPIARSVSPRPTPSSHSSQESSTSNEAPITIPTVRKPSSPTNVWRMAAPPGSFVRQEPSAVPDLTRRISLDGNRSRRYRTSLAPTTSSGLSADDGSYPITPQDEDPRESDFLFATSSTPSRISFRPSPSLMYTLPSGSNSNASGLHASSTTSLSAASIASSRSSITKSSSHPSVHTVSGSEKVDSPFFHKRFDRSFKSFLKPMDARSGGERARTSVVDVVSESKLSRAEEKALKAAQEQERKQAEATRKQKEMVQKLLAKSKSDPKKRANMDAMMKSQRDAVNGVHYKY